ncbi:hypothetical protein [Herbaspirillum sp. WGmk3]|nr:hypothetical protein [Herbaspirillum sp. WGmk3]
MAAHRCTRIGEPRAGVQSRTAAGFAATTRPGGTLIAEEPFAV